MVLGLTRLNALEGKLLGILAVVCGAVITETAITRVCPLNNVAGIDTARRKMLIPKHRADGSVGSGRAARSFI